MLHSRLIEDIRRFLVVRFDTSNVEWLLQNDGHSYMTFDSARCPTLDESRLDRLIIELRKIVPAVSGRRVIVVILFSPSGHIEETVEFLLW